MYSSCRQFLALDSPIPDEIDYPTATSAIIAQANLAALANEIHCKFWSLKVPHAEANHDTALTMEVKLFNWRNTLPGYFTSSAVPEWFLGPRAVVLWKAQNLRMLLWRTSQWRHATAGGRSVADWKCYAAAVETIRDVSVFCRERAGALHAGLGWYATYFLFQAILVLEMSQVVAAPDPSGAADSLAGDKSWSQAIAQGRSCLELLKPNTAAGRCLETLDRLHASLFPGGEPSQTPAPDGLQMTAAPQDQAMPGPGIGAEGDMAVDPGFFDLPWNMSADPSLHMLLNGRQMDTIFQGVEGFPGTLDQESFSYQGGYSFDF
jgi:transcriptional regulatory protein GAL4